MRRNFLVVGLTGLLVSCSFSADISGAQQGIAAFHSDLNAGAFEKIYNASAPAMKSATSKEEFVKFLNAVHTKLGPFMSGKSVGWNDNATTNGHYVTITYHSSYQKGPADESFVYQLGGNQATLVGYHVSSNALITN